MDERYQNIKPSNSLYPKGFHDAGARSLGGKIAKSLQFYRSNSNLVALNSESSDILAKKPSVLVCGVGSAGCTLMGALSLDWPKWRVDTDAQALANCPHPETHSALGLKSQRGLSAGGDLEQGRRACLEDADAIRERLKGVHLLILITGLGGGTGSGAAPVIAELASTEGTLVLSFATLPFPFEGKRRIQQAQLSLEALRKASSAVIPLPNSLLLQRMRPNASVLEAFNESAFWINCGTQALDALLFKPGLMNVDLSHLRQLFKAHGGPTLFGFAQAKAPHLSDALLTSLKQCPLLRLPEFSQHADRLLVHFQIGTRIGLDTLNVLMAEVNKAFCSKDESYWSVCVNDSWDEDCSICILGTTHSHDAHSVHQLHWAKPNTPKARSRTQSTAPSQKPNQTEFNFSFEQSTPKQSSDQRFPDPRKRLYKGEDLDVPTFLRKGIPIKHDA